MVFLFVKKIFFLFRFTQLIWLFKCLILRILTLSKRLEKMSVNSTAKKLLFSVVSMMLKMPIVYFFIVHPILTWVFVYINCPTRAIQLTEVRSLGKNQGCGTMTLSMCMKKWVFDPPKKTKQGFLDSSTQNIVLRAAYGVIQGVWCVLSQKSGVLYMKKWVLGSSTQNVDL